MTFALGLDCSGETYSVGISGGRGISLEAGGFQPRRALREIPGAISYLLKTAELSHSDLTVVGVTQGPGSFTGVRLGATVAKTVALIAGCPICPWDTLELLARQSLPQPSFGTAAVALDARRGELYCGVFRFRKDAFDVVLPTGVRTPQEFQGELSNLETCQAAIGSGFAAYPDLLAVDWRGARYQTRENSAPSGRLIAELSLQHQAQWIASAELLPVYHRQADIQVSTS